MSPASVTGGAGATGTIALSAPAPATGAQSPSQQPAGGARPASVGIGAGAISATFPITTSTVASTTTANVTAGLCRRQPERVADGATRCAATLATLALQPPKVAGGTQATGSVARSTAPAPAGGLVVTLASSNGSFATLPASVTIAGGASSATFPIETAKTRKNRTVTISATTPTRTLKATLTVSR